MLLKKLFFFICCVMLFSQKINAQDIQIRNIIRVAPVGLADKVRLHYEFVPGKVLTFGAIGTYYYPKNFTLLENPFTGIKGEAFMRIYLEETAPDGVYLQPSIAVGTHQINSYYADSTQSFMAKGGAFAIGYQTQLGSKKAISIDFNIGLQFYKLNTDIYFVPSENGDGQLLVFGWYSIGPGSVISPKFSIGYAF